MDQSGDNCPQNQVTRKNEQEKTCKPKPENKYTKPQKKSFKTRNQDVKTDGKVSK